MGLHERFRLRVSRCVLLKYIVNVCLHASIHSIQCSIRILINQMAMSAWRILERSS